MLHDGKISRATLERAEHFHNPPQLRGRAVVLTAIFEVEQSKRFCCTPVNLQNCWLPKFSKTLNRFQPAPTIIVDNSLTIHPYHHNISIPYI